ncbi:MAG TPA: AAA family ATPase [Pirellulales bacterium]|nr:AAA family ATPase [Pirellulales bacterium]
MLRDSDSNGGRPSTGQAATSAAASPCEILRLDEIDGAETRWLWPERFPVGHVTVVAGEAGSGKSLLSAEIAARVSSGEAWPDAPDKRPAGSVVIVQSDRHLNAIVKRRLLAAGADPRRLAIVNRDGGPHEGMTPAEALLAKLESSLDHVADCSLVVVDDLLGWLKAGPRPDEQAALFDRLAELAARRQIALAVVWRLEKATRGGQARALDALLSAAPVVWMLAPDPYRSDRRLAVCARNQLGRTADNLAFQVAGDRLVWQAATRQMSADDVLAASARSVDRHERWQAGAWLLELLSAGPIEAKRLWEEARQCHLSERTVRRAAAELGLHPIKAGQGGPWLWGFGVALDEPVQTVAAFETVGSLPNPPVLEVEVRPGTPPSAAAFDEMASLPDSRVAEQAVSDDAAAPKMAAFETVGSLPNSAVLEVELRRDAAPSVAAFDGAGSLPKGEAAAKATTSRKRRRSRRHREERKAIERLQSLL